ncbi:Outer membrane protein TolC [Spirosomataceae bacterium TFI 002]|nr:Outer membrane protein TolC [Spirosomataceae bacterium TFI 002]
MRKILIIISLLGGFSLQTLAQKIGLDEAIDFALKNNLELKVADKEVQHKEAFVATFQEIPKTNLELQYGSIQLPNIGDYAFTLAQPFNHPAENKARKKLYESYVNQSLTEREIRVLELKKAVRSSYYTLTFQSRLLDFLSDQDTLYSKAIRRAEIRYKQGETSILERTNLSMQRDQLKNNMQQTQYQLSMEQQKLKELLQWKSGDLIVEKEELENEILLGNPSGESPFLSRFDRLSEVNQEQINLTQAGLKPSFLAGVTNQSMNGSLSQFVIMGGINIPIFQKSGKAKVEAFKVQDQVIAAQKEALNSKITMEVENLVTELRSKNSELNYLKQSALPSAELITQTAQKQYMIGDINYLEYQQNFKQALDIRQQYLNKLLEQKIIEININYLLGR